jgi:hypothetical protein
MPKLFHCEVTITYYALAETAKEAEDCVDDAVRDTYLRDCLDTTEVDVTKPVRTPLMDGWTMDSLVYGPAKDTTLAEAIVLAQHVG